MEQFKAELGCIVGEGKDVTCMVIGVSWGHRVQANNKEIKNMGHGWVKVLGISLGT